MIPAGSAPGVGGPSGDLAFEGQAGRPRAFGCRGAIEFFRNSQVSRVTGDRAGMPERRPKSPDLVGAENSCSCLTDWTTGSSKSGRFEEPLCE